jgi:hypothetical protein
MRIHNWRFSQKTYSLDIMYVNEPDLKTLEHIHTVKKVKGKDIPVKVFCCKFIFKGSDVAVCIEILKAIII